MILRRAYVLLGLASAALLGTATFPATSADTTVSRVPDDTIGAIALEYGQMRTAPGNFVSGEALLAARAEADAMSGVGGRWKEITNQPYNEQPAGYNDPVWSNAFPPPGAGFSIASGRVTALAESEGTLYAGEADGGVWKLDEGESSWQPIGDRLPTLSIGALAVNPANHALWVGSGEANTSSDSYNGVGVFVMNEDGGFRKVGGDGLNSRTIYQLAFDGAGGVYAATNRGLFKTGAGGTGTWTKVLQPDPADTFPPYTNHITTVVVAPGSHGQHVVAVNGWRGSPNTAFNGFFESLDGGATFTQTATVGISQADIGRTSMAYGSDGRLYAVVESPVKLLTTPSNLQGVFESKTGAAAGPWTQIADELTLQNSGSALSEAIGFPVGVQTWYNNVLAVNPNNPDQLYVGLEEVFQTNDGGKHWKTASPYWNFGLACNPNCPLTTHPDQHALLITGGRIVEGNDGGVYSRPLSHNGYGDWTNLNATLHTLQYYDAKAGNMRGGLAFWGGMQDNATSFLMPHARQNIGPASGDGFDVIVDPNNANRAVGEYTNLATYLTTDGGHNFVTASPSCVGQDIGIGARRADCDHNARFWAPYTTDSRNINNWIGGGRYVWNTTKGWDTRCTLTNCDWKQVYDLGSTHAATAVAQTGTVEYAAWVQGGNPSAAFDRGIATNYGGTWHQLNVSSLPKRFIAGVTIDSASPAHVYAIMNGYSRRWIPGGGVGVVFESKDGGNSWADISGNLPDAPGNALVIVNGQLVLATDVGVFAAKAGTTHWARAGSGLPNTSVNDVTVAPDHSTVVAATHGRGIWTLTITGSEDEGGD